MTPTQEVCNALTMLLCTMVFAYETVAHWPNPWLTGLLCGGVMHLPVSVGYHLRTACVQDVDPCKGDLCRLDQSMIHVSGAVFAFVLSGGSVPYTAAHLCFGVFAISRIWPEESERRWVLASVSTLGWMLPMAARGYQVECVAAVVTFYSGGLCFTRGINERYLRGWGHSVFHVLAACTSYCMCATVHASPLYPSEWCGSAQ